MTAPVAALTGEIVAGVVLAGALISDAGRAGVIALAGVMTIACAKWLWGAIVRQIKAAIVEVEREEYTKLAEAITSLAASNEQQHAENGARLDGIEKRTALVEANTAVQGAQIANAAQRTDEIISTLAQLGAHVAELRNTQLATTPKESHHHAP